MRISPFAIQTKPSKSIFFLGGGGITALNAFKLFGFNKCEQLNREITICNCSESFYWFHTVDAHTRAYDKEGKMDIFNIETSRPEEFNEKDEGTRRKEN